MPIYDREANIAGCRGFGICSDFDGMARLAALRRDEFVSHPPAPQTLSAVIVQPKSADIVQTYIGDSLPAEPPAKPDVASSDTPESPESNALESNALEPNASETTPQTHPETAPDTPQHLPTFRPVRDPNSPA